MNGKEEMIFQETLVAYLNALSHHSPGGTEGKYENPQSG
jgi:hypothetical protein